ncbi:MAG TPA: penicillin-binding protein 2 [Burkholderiaceae bacterium]|nr:penicillin-binding protein 2 [Burkholderiaceae bacterium]HQR71850.1 penicillin-binding protein 2 [Burkholderiaceae bacterium]
MLTVALPAWRSKLLLFLLFVGFVSLSGRAFYLMGGVTTGFLQRQGEARYARTLEIPATRGRITDRNGVVLASSVPARAVWAIPEDVDATPAQLVELARMLDMSLAELKRRIDNDDRSFVYLRRQVDVQVADRIAAMKIAGVHSSREFKRHYPEGPTSAHLVGFTNVEDRGQEGMELAFERQLAGRAGSRRVIKDRLGRVVEDDWLREPVDGRDLTLSIDSRVQYIAYSALKNAIDKHQARAGAAIVLDVKTGEVLALVNSPTFDPNARGRLSGEAIRNRVLTDTFEPGSTMKPFAIATALEQGKVRPDSRIQTAPGKLTIGDRTIGDAHPHGMLTVEEVVAKSSNVGTAKIALELPAQTLWDSYTAFGFGQAPRLGFPGAVAGRLRPAKTWRPIEQATISYGHGVSVSLIQLARAYSAMARDGELVPLSLVKVEEPPATVQVISRETAAAMRRMLEMAVSDEGTAPAARIAGYRVAGKTGTAQKLKNGLYVKEYVASFAGFAPVSDPRLVIAVMIDEPSGSAYYGGQVAAPVFAQIAGASLRTLQVAPDGPLEAPRQMVAMERTR